MSQHRQGEVIPLLPSSRRVPSAGHIHQFTNLERINVKQKKHWDKRGNDDDDDSDDEDDDKILTARKIKSTSLVLNDCILSIINYIQVSKWANDVE